MGERETGDLEARNAALQQALALANLENARLWRVCARLERLERRFGELQAALNADREWLKQAFGDLRADLGRGLGASFD